MKLYRLETQPVQDTNEITFVILRVLRSLTVVVWHTYSYWFQTPENMFLGSLKWKVKFASAILGSSAIQLYLGESITAIQ